jgi:polysaccharide export outer membrane protein
MAFGLLATTARAQQIQPGDTVQIQVFQDSKLDRQVLVGKDGMIAFPLAGYLRASGLTPMALERLIRERLRDKYTGDLDITVSIVATTKPDEEFKPRIYVTGEVNRPGPYVIGRSVNLMQAIAMSGGLGRFAAEKRIQVRRRVNGVETIHHFNYRAFEAGYELDGNINLRAGDVVIVPERGLFE